MAWAVGNRQKVGENGQSARTSEAALLMKHFEMAKKGP
jgi:hypothetical protein